ncbi:MAG: adenosylcobalamin-dependent ribonucleoside-diphosphate reductase, partial [Bacilli bacterium]|nr:adenosylcobalamin-dependent ribonucleoside-diphosphate reductase [Bacilli bacterium]
VIYMKINPRLLWEKIVESAWLTGEPGVIFNDTINKYNPTPQLGRIESTTPCGEQPLLPYESCNLGSINLANMVIADTKRYKIDWDRLRDAIHVATRFLDNIIDINKYPLPKIEKRTKLTRKIGLGVMGWADLLFKLEIPYDSAEAFHLAAEIMSFIQKESHAYSSEVLAKERGCFPAWKESVWGQQNIPMRNATTTTIAPTGTISLIAGVSSGIEPVFALAYTKTLVDGGGVITELNPSFLEALRQRGYTADEIETIASQVSQTGTLRGLSLPRDITEVFVTALEIHPFDHVQMQAMFQNYTDNAVSKTINFNNDVTPDDISETLLSAYKLGCKGITVYRDGSRDSQPLTKGQKVKKEEEVVQEQESEANIVHKIKTKLVTKAVRPVELTGITKQVRTGCGTMFITINDYNGAIYEVFLKAGATGGCAAFTEGTARLISIALRYGVPVEEIIDQLRSVRCDNFRHQSGKDPQLKGKSCPDVVGRIMQEFINGQKEKQSEYSTLSILEATYQASLKDESLLKMQIPIAVLCPECGQELRMAE